MYKFIFFQLALWLFLNAAIAQTHDDLTFTHYEAYNGVEFEYVVLKPAHYDATKAYPALLAFSGGEQDRKAVEWSASHMWGSAAHRDWLIILPTIPEQSWHTHPSHHALEAFLDQVKKDYRVEGNTFHLTGFEEGSRAAITYANMSNKYFSSFTVTNPEPWNNWEDRYLVRWTKHNKHIPIRILVGEKDKRSLEAAERVEKFFVEGGISVKLVVLEGEDEHLESLQGGRMLAEVAHTAGH